MSSKTEITAEPGSLAIEMVHEFDAPAALVFRAYTDPDLLVQWLGPRRLRMRIDRLDVRDGGSYRYVHTDDAGAEFAFRGVYHGEPSIEAGIVQTFEFEGMPGHVSLDTARFEEHDGRTVVRGTSVFQSVADRDAILESGMADGAQEAYERLEELLAAGMVTA